LSINTAAQPEGHDMGRIKQAGTRGGEDCMQVISARRLSRNKSSVKIFQDSIRHAELNIIRTALTPP